jgi:hypothetical protein
MVWLHQSDTALEGVYCYHFLMMTILTVFGINGYCVLIFNGMSPSSSWGDYQGVGFDDRQFILRQISFLL